MQDGWPALDRWPTFDPEAAGSLPESTGGGNPFTVSPTEAAVCILAAHLGKGRPTLCKMLEDAAGNQPGGERSKKILAFGREAYEHLTNDGWTLCDEGTLTALGTHSRPSR